MTTAAVTIIVLAVFTLVVMTGIGGYTVGRAHAADAAKKASEADSRLNETLVGLKCDTLVVSRLLLFTQDRAFDYRRVAEEALANFPNGLRRSILEEEFKTNDKKMMAKTIEIQDYRKESKKG